MFIEAIVQNKEEAIQAEKLGVDRLELVSAISEGGLTPSHGTIKQVLESVSIPVQVMIRPHSYHYVYTADDLAAIYEDVRNVVNLGGTGIVFGALTKGHTINEQVLSDIIEIAPELDISFHRAFDEVPSQEDAYRTLENYRKNISRILTSGGEANCSDGKNNLRELVKLSEKLDGPKIMPGGGLSPNNIEMIHHTVGADQYHFGKALRIESSFANGFDERAVGFVRGIGGE
ncbi:copper homeostasis protein CutC [Lentibacillus sediminis]|uniref:copper homeostasis protein CutC n=1 Tax=Lentibacillus sediminis TaxID=1940529 RepID=UPI000C1C4CB1|nr:copper homeostasis protein CutC [Lentibacillus sediminis]